MRCFKLRNYCGNTVVTESSTARTMVAHVCSHTRVWMLFCCVFIRTKFTCGHLHHVTRSRSAWVTSSTRPCRWEESGLCAGGEPLDRLPQSSMLLSSSGASCGLHPDSDHVPAKSARSLDRNGHVGACVGPHYVQLLFSAPLSQQISTTVKKKKKKVQIERKNISFYSVHLLFPILTFENNISFNSLIPCPII